MTLRVLNTTSGTTVALNLVDEDGQDIYLSWDTHVAIDEDGNVVYANGDGIGIITNTGLAPGRTAFRSPYVYWTASVTCHYHQSSIGTPLRPPA